MAKILYLLMVILVSNVALAANIEGNIYSFDLEKRNNTIVTVDSTPPQSIVSKDSTYSFKLDKGEYTIKAAYTENNTIKESVTENIKIEKDGSYRLDLILFPDLEEDISLLEETDAPVIDTGIFNRQMSTFDIVMLFVALIGFVLIILLLLRYKKMLNQVTEEVEKAAEKTDIYDESRKIVDFIKEQDGRTTQKEIRKKFPSSESKISMIISELEQKDVIKKIKKGRGNIIILKQDD
ncbi:hypothetical protein GF336_06325 [Candidatus Woesearchaeota archaeon]|nr:hypothetical protein [Candidatus Woesearchaeota archaeon]